MQNLNHFNFRFVCSRSLNARELLYQNNFLCAFFISTVYLGSISSVVYGISRHATLRLQSFFTRTDVSRSQSVIIVGIFSNLIIRFCFIFCDAQDMLYLTGICCNLFSNSDQLNNPSVRLLLSVTFSL